MNTVLNFDFATFQFAFCVRIRLEFGGGDWLTGAAKCDTNLRRSVSALRRPSRYPTDAFVSIRLHLTSQLQPPEFTTLSVQLSGRVPVLLSPVVTSTRPTATNFDFISCTLTYRCVLQLEMRVRFICAIKFYPLTYLLLAAALPVHLMSFFVSLGLWFC